jgi:hypothetical protein
MRILWGVLRKPTRLPSSAVLKTRIHLLYVGVMMYSERLQWLCVADRPWRAESRRRRSASGLDSGSFPAAENAPRICFVYHGTAVLQRCQGYPHRAGDPQVSFQPTGPEPTPSAALPHLIISRRQLASSPSPLSPRPIHANPVSKAISH